MVDIIKEKDAPEGAETIADIVSENEKRGQIVFCTAEGLSSIDFAYYLQGLGEEAIDKSMKACMQILRGHKLNNTEDERDVIDIMYATNMYAMMKVVKRLKETQK